MPGAKAEMAYLNHRLAATIAMRDRASNSCAKAAHEGLAKLYRYRLAALTEGVPAALKVEPLIEQAREAAVVDRSSNHAFQSLGLRAELGPVFARMSEPINA